MSEIPITTDESSKKASITLRGAIFIGIGSMGGAGIFALFGEAGTIAGAAVWVSFLIAGIITLLQGYSFAKLGARFPSSGGLISWIVKGYGSGLFTGGLVVLGYFSVLIVTAMAAVSFGNYATSLFLGDGAPQVWVKILAFAIVIVLTYVNSIGAETVARAQTAIVTIVLIVLSGFAIAMLVQTFGEQYLNSYFGAFLGATLMAVSSEIIARSPRRTSTLASQMLAFWFLVPGARGLLSVTRLLSNDIQSAAIGIGEMVILIISIALGVLLGTLVVSPQKFIPVSSDSNTLQMRLIN